MHKALDRSLILAAAAAFMLMTAGCATPRGEPTDYAAVLSDGARPEADRARDAARRTDEVLAFAQVRPGQSIGDMIIGGGYFTRVFASAVGDSGRVVAWQPAEFIAFQASYGESLTAVDEAHENVTAIRSSIGAPEFPGGMDLIFTAQNYHDLHLQPFPAETAARVNAAVFQALKPGGLYVIIDHAALPGAGLTVANTLHRIDIADVRREVEAAGFVLDAESDILLNDTDALTVNVFDEAIRGRTSQFMLRFRKPA